MITVHILFFATLKERTGTARGQLDLPDGARVADLKEQVAVEVSARGGCAGQHGGFGQPELMLSTVTWSRTGPRWRFFRRSAAAGDGPTILQGDK